MEDVTVYPVWEKLDVNMQYGVWFDADDGEISIDYFNHSGIAVIHGKTLETEIPTATKEHYNFVGWTVDTNTNELVDPATYVITEVTTFYAVWESVTYELTINYTLYDKDFNVTNTSTEVVKVQYDEIYSVENFLSVPYLGGNLFKYSSDTKVRIDNTDLNLYISGDAYLNLGYYSYK